ncbi:MAG: cache domain-containing protein, partial [Deltaproteobacteria bacterium]|nr:cache domain-containing protein [Deltaproteobacteria bacterium]
MFKALKKFQIQLPLLLLLGTVLPLLAFGLISAELNRQALVNEIFRVKLHISRRGAEKITSVFDDLQHHMMIFSEFIDLSLLNREEQELQLSELLKDFPEVYGFSLLDGAGRELVRLSRDRVTLPGALSSLANDPLFIACRQGRKPVWGKVDAQDLGAIHQRLALPLLDPGSGQLTQVLLVKISLRPLFSEIEFIKLDQGGSIFVVNRSGLLLAHTDNSQVLARADFRQNPQVATFMQKKPVTPPRRYL